MANAREIDLEKLEKDDQVIDELVRMLEQDQTSASKADPFWTRQFPASGKGWG